MKQLNKKLVDYLLDECGLFNSVDERFKLFILSTVEFINTQLTECESWNEVPKSLKMVFQNNVNHFDFLTMTDEEFWNWMNCVDGCHDCETMDSESINVVVQWPESQYLIGVQDQYDASLINDELGLEVYGSSAYLLPKHMARYFEHDLASLTEEERLHVCD